MNRLRPPVQLAGALMLAGLLALWVVAIQSTHKVPVYQGKTLYEWILVLDQAADLHPANFDQVTAAKFAIRAIGTNALPFVMADLHAHATLNDRLAGWLANHAPFLKLHRANIIDAWSRGVQVLDILGPISEPCLAQLIAEATNNPGYSEEAMLAVGPAALPAFTNLLQSSQYPEAGYLIRALIRTVNNGQIKRSEATVALPCLTAAVRFKVAASAAAEAIATIEDNRPRYTMTPGTWQPR